MHHKIIIDNLADVYKYRSSAVERVTSPTRIMINASRPNVGVLGNIFRDEVLPRLNPTDLAMVARVGDSEMREHVVGSGLPRAGTADTPLNLMDFIDSVHSLQWALRASGAQTDPPGGMIYWGSAEDDICDELARKGNLEVLKWVRKQNPPPRWDIFTVDAALDNGHTHILDWMGRAEAERTGCDSLRNIDHVGVKHIGQFRLLLAELLNLIDRPTDLQRFASNGDTNTLRFLHQVEDDIGDGHTVTFQRDTVVNLGEIATENGQYDTVMWLCQTFKQAGWDYHTLSSMANYNMVDVDTGHDMFVAFLTRMGLFWPYP
jgi:hypothetical protein